MVATILHVGCGPREIPVHPFFSSPEWREVRLDLDPTTKPDIVASIMDMHPVADGSVEAVYSSHNLEHLYPHEVPVALAEFRRVLASSGVAFIELPDLQSVAKLVADGNLDDTAYTSQIGPIAPIDMMFGLRSALAQGNLFMAHRTGFTAGTLAKALASAGFAYVSIVRYPSAFALHALAFAREPDPGTLDTWQKGCLG